MSKTTLASESSDCFGAAVALAVALNSSPNIRERFLITCSLALDLTEGRKTLPMEASPESCMSLGCSCLNLCLRTGKVTAMEASIILRVCRSHRQFYSGYSYLVSLSFIKPGDKISQVWVLIKDREMDQGVSSVMDRSVVDDNSSSLKGYPSLPCPVITVQLPAPARPLPDD